MAASGPTALATSFAPCAKDKSAAEAISGTANSFFRLRLRFSNPSDWRRTMGRKAAQVTKPMTSPSSSDWFSVISTTLRRPLAAR